jgi:hypothetical protein
MKMENMTNSENTSGDSQNNAGGGGKKDIQRVSSVNYWP